MEKHQTYWQESLAEQDLEKWLGNSRALYNAYVFDRIRRYKSVIDCGAGVFSQHQLITEFNLDIRYVATEITKRFVDIGIERGIEVYHCPVEKMNVPDQYCEVAICLAVLNHQLDFKNPIMELLRVAEKEVIISFFKPFMGEIAACEEILKNQNKHPIINMNKNIGVSIQRHKKFIYTFFAKSAIEKFLDNLPVKYFFEVLEDHTIMLHIIKQEDK